jgi:hypothetical protein
VEPANLAALTTDLAYALGCPVEIEQHRKDRRTIHIIRAVQHDGRAALFVRSETMEDVPEATMEEAWNKAVDQLLGGLFTRQEHAAIDLVLRKHFGDEVVDRANVKAKEHAHQRMWMCR